MATRDSGSALNKAREYTRRGWSVVPLWWPASGGGCSCRLSDCASPGKHPIPSLVPHGLRDATTSPGTVRTWWRSMPYANVGIRTGAESGLVVLDVDGQAGAKTLQALVERHGRFAGAWVRTGSGGWHAYFAHSGDTVPNSAGRAGEGLDIRGDGGYVVAPPSIHTSGSAYRWLRSAPAQLPSMPEWLLALARPVVQQPIAPQPIAVRGNRLSSYVMAAVSHEANQVACTPVGLRNHRLNQAAYRLGQLVGGSYVSEHTVTAALANAAAAAGLPEQEARVTIRSGLRAGMIRPRALDVSEHDMRAPAQPSSEQIQHSPEAEPSC